MRKQAPSILLPSTAVWTSFSFRPGMPKGCSRDRRRLGMRLPIGALLAAEYELQGMASIVPRTFPFRMQKHISSTLPLASKLKPKAMSSKIEFALPARETFRPTRPTPPKTSRKMSPRAAQHGRADARFPPHMLAGASNRNAGNPEMLAADPTTKPGCTLTARTS